MRSWIGNGDYPLWQVVRASTGGPGLLRPGDPPGRRRGRKEERDWRVRRRRRHPVQQPFASGVHVCDARRLQGELADRRRQPAPGLGRSRQQSDPRGSEAVTNPPTQGAVRALFSLMDDYSRARGDGHAVDLGPVQPNGRSTVKSAILAMTLLGRQAAVVVPSLRPRAAPTRPRCALTFRPSGSPRSAPSTTPTTSTCCSSWASSPAGASIRPISARPSISNDEDASRRWPAARTGNANVSWWSPSSSPSTPAASPTASGAASQTCKAGDCDRQPRATTSTPSTRSRSPAPIGPPGRAATSRSPWFGPNRPRRGRTNRQPGRGSRTTRPATTWSRTTSAATSRYAVSAATFRGALRAGGGAGDRPLLTGRNDGTGALLALAKGSHARRRA